MRILALFLTFFILGSSNMFAEEGPSPDEFKLMKSSYQKAMKEMKEGNLESAVALFKQVLRINPKMAQVHNLIGIAYLQMGQREDAIDSFMATIRHDETFADAYFNLANIYMGADGDKEMAYEYYKKTIEYNDQHAKAYFGLGWLEMLQKEDPQTAAEMFERVVELKRDFAQGHFGLGMAYLRLNKPALALQPVSELRRLHEDDMALRIEAIMRGEGENYEEEVVLPGSVQTQFEEPAQGAAPQQPRAAYQPPAQPQPAAANPIQEDYVDEGGFSYY